NLPSPARSCQMTAKDERLLSCLLAEPTVTAAAKAASYAERTAYRRLRDPEFAQAYREARRAAMDAAIARLQAAGAEFIGVLREVATDAEARASARVSAARAGLEMAMKASEVEDLAVRLSELEAVVEKLGAAEVQRNGTGESGHASLSAP